MPITKRMLNPGFRVIQFATYYGIFPVKLDYREGKVYRPKSKLPIIMNALLQFICFCKLTQYTYQTIRRLVDFEADKMHILLLDVLMGTTTIIAMFWNYDLFHRGLDETLLLFNSLHFPPEDHLIIGRNQKRIHRWLSLGKKMLKTFRQFGLLEFLVVTSPSVVVPFLPNYVALALVFPEWDFFITSAYPVHESSVGLYGIVLVLEASVSAFVVFNIFFLFFFEMTVQVVHITEAAALVEEVKSLSEGDIEASNELMDRYAELFKFYHVIISLCNILYNRILYTGKLMAFICSILGTFYFMTHLQTGSPMVLGFFILISVDAILFYVISCQKLFDIPELTTTAKHSMSLIVGKSIGSMTEAQRKFRLSQVRAFPVMGISDGGFHVMESISILVFIDFYLNQVISLLLMWYEPE